MPGLYFEEFGVGQIFDHPIRRTITEADNVLLTTMTHNPASLHLDAEYMKNTEFGKPLVNSCLTLSLMVGISVNDTTHGTTVANLGWDEVRFPKPLFHGDTIRIETEVIDPTVSSHSGRIVKRMGDGYLVEFQSVVSAVECALSWQASAVDPIVFRMGINLGDVIVEDDDLYGDGVNVAARLEALAETGGICLSEDAWRQIRGTAPVGPA